VSRPVPEGVRGALATARQSISSARERLDRPAVTKDAAVRYAREVLAEIDVEEAAMTVEHEA